MKEFRDVHAHATGSGRRKFLIPILFQDVIVEDLDADLKFYLSNHTYVEYKCLVSSLEPNLKHGFDFVLNLLQTKINSQFPWDKTFFRK